MNMLVVVSGYFNPVHIGHLNLFKSAKQLGDKLLVIVNNDKQQELKKGKIIMNEQDRMEIVKAIRYVDEVVLSIDEDRTVAKTLEKIALSDSYADFKIIFANGGDRDSEKVIPETQVCKQYGIESVFGVGGTAKQDSSSDINRLRGLE
jgi:cytidyltransferase-like protein